MTTQSVLDFNGVLKNMYEREYDWRHRQKLNDIQYLHRIQEPRCLLSTFTDEQVLQSEYVEYLRLLKRFWDGAPSDISYNFMITVTKSPHETRTDVAWFKTTIEPATAEAERMFLDLDNFVLEAELTQ